MIFKYTGQITDSISYDNTDIFFNPDSEIELSDDLQKFPYISRMIQNGFLKAISKASKEESPPVELTQGTTAPTANAVQEIE